MMKAQGSWEKSSEYYILREVRSCALELCPGAVTWSCVSGCCTSGTSGSLRLPVSLPMKRCSLPATAAVSALNTACCPACLLSVAAVQAA